MFTNVNLSSLISLAAPLGVCFNPSCHFQRIKHLTQAGLGEEEDGGGEEKNQTVLGPAIGCRSL